MKEVCRSGDRAPHLESGALSSNLGGLMSSHSDFGKSREPQFLLL